MSAQINGVFVTAVWKTGPGSDLGADAVRNNKAKSSNVDVYRPSRLIYTLWSHRSCFLTSVRY